MNFQIIFKYFIKEKKSNLKIKVVHEKLKQKIQLSCNVKHFDCIYIKP